MSYRIISTPGPWRTVASTLRFVEKYPSCVPWLSRRTEEREPDGSSTGRLLVPKPAAGLCVASALPPPGCPSERLPQGQGWGAQRRQVCLCFTAFWAKVSTAPPHCSTPSSPG